MVLRNAEVGRRKLGLSAASQCYNCLPLVNFLVAVIPGCSGEIGLAQQTAAAQLDGTALFIGFQLLVSLLVVLICACVLARTSEEHT